MVCHPAVDDRRSTMGDHYEESLAPIRRSIPGRRALSTQCVAYVIGVYISDSGRSFNNSSSLHDLVQDLKK